jgi:hypothetical protein
MPDIVCYNCESPLAETDERCPQCGRGQFRVCFCGQRIRKAEAHCPHCSADWTHKQRDKERRKHRRRSSHRRRKFVWQKLYTYILVGLVGGAIGVSALTALVQRLSQPTGEAATNAEGPTVASDTTTPGRSPSPPPEPDALTRLQTSLKDFLVSLGSGFVRFFSRAWRIIRNHPAGFGGAALGAALGGLMYAKGRRLLRWGKRKPSSKPERRERRRRRAY